MDACTKRNIMIYAHKNYKREVRRDKGKFYVNDKLVFQGFAFKALKMFIGNCNDDNVNKQFEMQLTMRERCQFKREERNDKEKNK